MSIHSIIHAGIEMKKSVIKRITEEATRSHDGVLAKFFMNGGSQAIRIPADMRFAGDQARLVYSEEFKAVVILPISKEEQKLALIAELRAASAEEKKELSKLRYVKRYREARVHPDIEKMLEESE